MEELLSVDEFAEKIKSKYPQYASMDNLSLVKKIIAKYPQYENQVDMNMVSTDVAGGENTQADFTSNNQIINSTMVNGKPFTELTVKEQEDYITSAGNYATDKDGNLLFIPRNKQEADAVWDYPQDSSGRRYFPDPVVIESEEEKTEVVEDQPSNIFDFSLDAVKKRKPRDPNIEILQEYMLGNSTNSTINVGGQRILPNNIKKENENVEVTVADETFDLLNINKQDYVNWEVENFRKEDPAFKFVQGLLRTDKGEKKAIQKRNAEKLSAYLLTLSNGIENDLSIVQSKLKYTQDPIERAELLKQEETLKADLFNNLNNRIKLVNTNKFLKEERESQIELNREVFIKGQGEDPGSYVIGGAANRLKELWNVVPEFFGGMIRILPSIPDQILSVAGADDKGILAATDEALATAIDNVSFDLPERSAFVDGKKVYSVVNGKNHPFIVTRDGRVIDEITHVDMEGILSDSQYQNIVENSKGEETETFYSGGGAAQNFTRTIGNLVALIRSGKWISKGLNKALKKGGSKTTSSGATGMGIASYTSTAVGEVDDIRETLVRSGMSEKEALKYAIVAGNSRATLDGIFSGLAGSNVKLLDSYKNISKSIVDIAKNPTTWAKKGIFQDKVKNLVKENAKELFIEELPVLYSGKGINALVNLTLEEDILNDRATNAEFYETVMMTLGATTTLGARGLMTGNSRSSLVELASHAPDVKKTINKLVAEGMITKEEGNAAYDEIYAMQIANNNTQGAIQMPENKIKYSNLAEQRKELVTQEENLSGPGKERVRKKIEAIDAEMEALIKKDEADVKAETEKIPEKSSKLEVEEVTVTEEEVMEELKRRKPNSDTYTDAEMEIVRNELIKSKQDAIQESSTESLDVQEPTTDSETVGKGDTQGIVTEEGSQEVEDATGTQPETQVILPEQNKEQVNEAQSVVKKIKRLIKKGNAPAEVLDAAKEFVKLNPNNINDLDSFIKNANSIVQGLTPVKTGRKGEVKISEALDVQRIDQYTKEEQAAQEKFQAEADQRAFADLTGLDPKDFSLNELRRILYNFETENLSPEEKAKLRETKKGVIAQGLKNAFSKYSAVVNNIIKTGVDPFTGKKVKLSAADKKLVSEFLKTDLNNIPAEDAAKALGAMVNFATNQSVGGLKAIVNFAKGRQNAVDNENKLKAKPLKFLLGGKFIGNMWNQYLASLPQTIEQMFKSQKLARIFEKVSGFTDIRNGVAKADKIAQDIAEAYYNKFVKPKGLSNKTKTMPNGKRFSDVENDIERGLFAFMRRTVDGTEAEQDAEFKRRKKLIELSIEELKNDGQTEKAENYQKVYDKLLKDSNSINELEKKTDPINKEAVEWMTQEWSKARPELEDVSLSIYNRTLGKDINYTPDSFSRLDNVESQPNLDKPIFQPDTNETIYDEETGVLKVKRPSNVLPMDSEGKTNRYVNLGFDSNNVNNLRAAYTDVNTAPGIQQLKGFMSSPSFEKIIPNVDDRKLIKDRFRGYVEKKRGLQKGQEKWLRLVNRYAGIGVSRVLGGPTQYVKQLVPLINTFMNTINNPLATFRGVNLMATNTAAIKWLENTGVEIVNRGIQAVTNLEGTDSRLENDSTGKAGRIADIINSAQKTWLQGFLINPDRFAARASFMAYYLDGLKKQGVETANIDWNTHESNQEALDYATQQVARQQNTSDVDLQGELFSSKSPGMQLARKVFFPFANFLLNQKTRMYNDLGSVFSKSNTLQDKAQSAKSLGGLVAETATFNTVGLFITQMLSDIARDLRGTDEDEEKLEKQLQNRIKGRAGQVVQDILSPIPLLNPTTTEGVNALIETFDSEEPFQFFVNNPEGLLERLGVLGIPGEKAVQVYKMVKLGTTGKYTDRFGREIEIDPQYKDDILSQAPMYTLYLLGFLPLEAGAIMDYNMRAYEKSREKKPVVITPKKKESKKPKPNSGPGGRRNRTGPKKSF